MKKLLQIILIKTYGTVKSKSIKKFIRLLLTNLDGGEFWSLSLREIYKKYHGIVIGYGTYGGAFDFDKIPFGTQFGNYCSIANNVFVFNGNHPKNYFTMHPLFYNASLGYVPIDCIPRVSLKVGHDVWIGANSIILPSVTSIGNGAIVGAGSVVTKDVNPYEIVAGNPARVVGHRFTEDVIRNLEQSKWWELPYDKLIKNRDQLETYVNYYLDLCEGKFS